MKKNGIFERETKKQKLTVYKANIAHSKHKVLIQGNSEGK